MTPDELLGDRDRALEWLAKSETVKSTNFNFVLFWLNRAWRAFDQTRALPNW
jgi:hypothetical protein